MRKPVILFIPVSSTEGVGEYTRSVVLANAVQQTIKECDIHFILNKHVQYAHDCPFTVHFSNHSPTKDTPTVKRVLKKIRPDLVIFDCAGRSIQLAYAKSLGTKVIFISQHKKKRSRGLKTIRLLNTDLHWVVQPQYVIPALGFVTKLKLKILGKNQPKYIGPILPKIEPDITAKTLATYQLNSNEFFLFGAGSGGHQVEGRLVADIFYQAAVKFCEQTKIPTIMVFGPNYPKELPENNLVLCFKYIPSTEFVVLLNEARGRVIGAGDTLLQAIELQKPSVATVVSKDQPARLERCFKQNLVIKASTDEKSLVDNAMCLLNEDIYRKIEQKMLKLQPICGIDIALSDIKKLVGFEDSELEKKTRTKRFLFFVSQNYSFPVLRPLQNEIDNRGDEVRWFLYGNEVSCKHLTKNERVFSCVEEIIEYKPDAVFVPGNVVPSFIPGLKIQVFHGLPSTKAKKNGQLYHYIIRGMFDLYCTQGPSSTSKFNQLKEKYRYFSVKETGWSKLDPLFDKSLVENVERKKTIFFASTFSPRFSKAEVLYPVVLKMMQELDYRWYVTLHPKMNAKVVELYKSINLPNVQFVESTELIKGFKESDLMLCDTSSIIYEFLTQLKPVITFQTEKEEPHLINVKALNELRKAIISVLDDLSINQENIEKNVAHFHPYADGRSSVRILSAVDDMLAGNNLPIKEKPRNWLRNFKLRKELDYWKL